MDFATSLKHKRQEFNVANLIGSLDVKEKVIAEDSHTKGLEENFSANLLYKKNFWSQKKAKGKSKKANANQTTDFKKKKANKKGECFICSGIASKHP